MTLRQSLRGWLPRTPLYPVYLFVRYESQRTKVRQHLRQHLTEYQLMPRRFFTATRYYRGTFRKLVTWTWRSRELANYTYDLDERNKRYLAAFVAAVTDVPIERAEGYIAEIDADAALREHVRNVMERRGVGSQADSVARFGRRIGWYALVRAAKPALVIETGVDKGLGSCVLCAALIRNAAEGAPGRYAGTDLNPSAGFLLQPPYSGVGRVLYGDSITSLRELVAGGAQIDLFINDSDHSADYERREYDTVAAGLTADALLVGDNAHVTDELLDFAKRSGRAFLYFQEKPANHWYPGGGIGVAYRNRSR